jgi:hypothetical protein
MEPTGKSIVRPITAFRWSAGVMPLNPNPK